MKKIEVDGVEWVVWEESESDERIIFETNLLGKHTTEALMKALFEAQLESSRKERESWESALKKVKSQFGDKSRFDTYDWILKGFRFKGGRNEKS